MKFPSPGQEHCQHGTEGFSISIKSKSVLSDVVMKEDESYGLALNSGSFRIINTHAKHEMRAAYIYRMQAAVALVLTFQDESGDAEDLPDSGSECSMSADASTFLP